MILRLFRKTKNKELLLAALVLAAAFFIFLGLPSEKATVKLLEQPREYQAKKEPTEESIIYKKKQEILETASTDTSKGQRIESVLKSKEASLIEISGSLTAIKANSTSDTVYFFEEGGVKKELLFSKEPKEPIPSQKVTVSGLATDAEIIVATEENISLAGNLKASPVTGARSVLVIVHNFSDVTFATNRDQNGNLYTPDDSISTANLTGIMTTSPNSVRNFYQEASYGALSLNVTVTSVLTSAHSFAGLGCTEAAFPSISLNARNAAAGYSPGSFDHIIYVFPFSHLCTFESSIYAGVAEWPGDEVWINGNMNTMVYAHELGHNYGLGHANYYNCGTQTIGTSCTSVEYGDFFDTMGSQYAHFNASMKEYLGWLSGGRVQTVNSSGTFTIHPMSSPENNLKALKIPIGTTGRFYYIEYRQPTGFDSGLPTGGTRGAQIRIGSGDSTNTNILDMTPTGVLTFANLQDVAMVSGQDFLDSSHNLRIRQISAGTSGLVVGVDLSSPPANIELATNLRLSSSSPKTGESVLATAIVRNASPFSISLERIGIANWHNHPDPNIRDFGMLADVVLAPGEELALSFDRVMLETGSYRAWIVFRHNGVWYSPKNNGLIDFINYTASLPNIQATWFNVPPSGISGKAFTPELRVRNFENVDIRLNSVGIANWLNWPQPNMRDFGFSGVLTIPAGQEINIPMPERVFTEPGTYRAWAIFRIGNSWHPITHVTGWPASRQGIIVRLPNVQVSFLDVPSVITSGATVSPNFRVRNFESVPINLTFGVANWLNWPNPNMRDFGFTPVSIPARSEATVNVGTRALTERGTYRTFALMRVRNNFYQLMHTTGWPSVFWIEVR